MLNIAERIDLAIHDADNPTILILHNNGWRKLNDLVGNFFLAHKQNGIVFGRDRQGIIKFRNLRIIKSDDLAWDEVIVC